MSPPKISIANPNQKTCKKNLIEQNVKQILKILGEDYNRPGLADTPKRVVRAWEDFLSGYFHANQPVEMVKSALFKINDDEDDFEQEKKNLIELSSFEKNGENVVMGSSESSSQISNSKSDDDESSTEILCAENEFDFNSSQNSNGVSEIDKYDTNETNNIDFVADKIADLSNMSTINGCSIKNGNFQNFPTSNLKLQNPQNQQLIVVKDIEFVSISSEDLWPVLGKCHVGYVPGNSGLVVGLSKIARICRNLSQRLTNQQQLLQQLLNTIKQGLNPHGVAVLIETQNLQLGGQIQTEFMVSYQGCFLNRSDGKFFEDFATAMALHGIDTDRAIQIPFKNGNGHSGTQTEINLLNQIQIEKYQIQEQIQQNDDTSNFFDSMNFLELQRNEKYLQNGTSEKNKNYDQNVEQLLQMSQHVEKMLQMYVPACVQVPQYACIRYADRLLQQCTYTKNENSLDFKVKKLDKIENFDLNLNLQGYGCRFSSMCEHHILPFYGKFWIIIKNAINFSIHDCQQLVNTYSRKLQMQERLTQQICEGVGECEGVLVVCEAYHMCMLARGVQSRKSNTVTIISRGCFETDFELRRKILGFVRRDQTDF